MTTILQKTNHSVFSETVATRGPVLWTLLLRPALGLVIIFIVDSSDC